MPLASFIGRALNGPIYNKIGRFSLHLFYGMLLAGLILAGENIGNFFSTQWRVYINKLSDGTLRSAFHINAYFVAAVLVLCFIGTFIMMKMEKKQQLA